MKPAKTCGLKLHNLKIMKKPKLNLPKLSALYPNLSRFGSLQKKTQKPKKVYLKEHLNMYPTHYNFGKNLLNLKKIKPKLKNYSIRLLSAYPEASRCGSL